MASTKLIFTGLLLGAIAALWAAEAPSTPSQNRAFGTDVQISPNEKSQHGFSIRVKVTDLTSGTVVAAPHLIVPAGEAAEAKSELPDQSTVTVSAKVDPTRHTANYSIAVKKNDQVLSSYTANVNLQ